MMMMMMMMMVVAGDDLREFALATDLLLMTTMTLNTNLSKESNPWKKFYAALCVRIPGFSAHLLGKTVIFYDSPMLGVGKQIQI